MATATRRADASAASAACSQLGCLRVTARGLEPVGTGRYVGMRAGRKTERLCTQQPGGHSAVHGGRDNSGAACRSAELP